MFTAINALLTLSGFFMSGQPRKDNSKARENRRVSAENKGVLITPKAGNARAVVAVQAVQVKVSRAICAGRNRVVMDGKPACS